MNVSTYAFVAVYTRSFLRHLHVTASPTGSARGRRKRRFGSHRSSGLVGDGGRADVGETPREDAISDAMRVGLGVADQSAEAGLVR